MGKSRERWTMDNPHPNSMLGRVAGNKEKQAAIKRAAAEDAAARAEEVRRMKEAA